MKIENIKSKKILEVSLYKIRELLILRNELELVKNDSFKMCSINTKLHVFPANKIKKDVKDFILSKYEERINEIEMELIELWVIFTKY